MKVMTEDDSTPAAPSLAGEGGFLPEMIKAVLERGLAAELTGHLGYEVGDPAGRGSPNSLAAYRDATLFKVIYGWGLRRTETSKLDLLDWGRNPAAAEFGRYGMLHVRYDEALVEKRLAQVHARGNGARRQRQVLERTGQLVDVVADAARVTASQDG